MMSGRCRPSEPLCGTVQADISEPVGAPAAQGRGLPRVVGDRSTRSEDGREGGAGKSRTDAHGVLVVLMRRQSSRGRPISSAVSKRTPTSTSSARPGRDRPSGLCSWGSAGQHELLTPVSARALIGAKQPRGATRPSSGAEFWIERCALPWGTTLPRRGRQQCAGEALARQKCVSRHGAICHSESLRQRSSVARFLETRRVATPLCLQGNATDRAASRR